ncbi:MAG: flagellar basal-body P-ring protein FlgI [Rickettsiaceae bacterium]|jgi:flagellar P-ring protein precursor FlgI|nr:flagellar basal-body P-ring protein FlgI [Rickettsiaceae bacterium]
MNIAKSLLLIISIVLSTISHANSRIKDIASIEGVRDNILVGYGLIVGLNGSGDNMKNSAFTQKGLTDFLEKLGVNIQGSDLKTKNIAAVTVTASLPAFARLGSKLDVKVSAIGDAKSLRGGMLLATPLLGADNTVYAVAQGPVSISDFSPASDLVKTKSKAIETTGIIHNGAIVESEIDFKLSSLNQIKLALNNPDLTTAKSIAVTINDKIPGNVAVALDPGTVRITVPSHRREDVVNFLADIEQLEIKTDRKAKVVIDEATGTIVMGENVKISPVAISQGNLLISVGGEAANISDDKRGAGFKKIGETESVSLNELVTSLNQLGVWPRDIVTILQNIKAAGALQAEIEVK